MMRLMSYYSPAAQFKEQGSLSYYYFLSDLLENFDEKAEHIKARLAETAAKIFTRKNLIVQEVGLKEEKQAVVNHLDAVIGDMPEGEACHTLSFVFRKPELMKASFPRAKCSMWQRVVTL